MFSNGVTKNAPATAYTPTPHALDALMKALDDDAVPIKREPESDPIYRERSFSLAQSISSLVHAPTIEPELIEGVIYTTKQEPAPLHFVEDASLVNFDAHHQGCSAVSTDEDVKYDCRSRVSSISGIDSGSEMSPKVQLKHEIYLPNDPKSDYNTIIRGSDPKNEPYKAPKHKAEELRLKDKQIAEQEAEFKQAIQQLKNKKMKEEEEERRLKRVNDGIDTRHRLAP
ncbi:hypothetical protein D6D20_01382 [Aureobasidium pullulans]|uniref:Uncharacterized protein n=1 Tax=Aureobasidium pullulans TaxID=5580 RepID=A0A4S8ZK53_AURPU|nr:hypothetical protein D6D20_01382 [Aureobasidium pullulans]THZ96454.1 hypothetical protein D6C82_07048 [Aureobasidium pullulans]